MRVYWDTSALLWYYGQGRMAEIRGVTRSHSLAEAFSALSGAGIQIHQADGSLKWKKLSPLLAAQVVARLHSCLEYSWTASTGSPPGRRSSALRARTEAMERTIAPTEAQLPSPCQLVNWAS